MIRYQRWGIRELRIDGDDWDFVLGLFLDTWIDTTHNHLFGSLILHHETEVFFRPHLLHFPCEVPHIHGEKKLDTWCTMKLLEILARKEEMDKTPHCLINSRHLHSGRVTYDRNLRKQLSHAVEQGPHRGGLQGPDVQPTLFFTVRHD